MSTGNGYETAFAEFVPFIATLRKAHGPRTVGQSVLDRFLSKLEQPAPSDPSACWKWAGLASKGMPFFTMGSVLIGAGRLAWILFHRTDPMEGARVSAACGTSHCVNPMHQVAVPPRKFTPKPFAPAVKRKPGRPRKIALTADVEADTALTIEELAPPEIQRLASAQFGDAVPEPRRTRPKLEWPKPVEIPAPKVTLLPSARREPMQAAQPIAPESAPLILLDDIIALLSVPGTALVTYPSKETTLMSPLGTYAGTDLLALFLSAVTDAGYRKVAA